jgi:hypothetical protein
MSHSERIAVELDKLQDKLMSVSLFDKREIVRMGLSGHLLNNLQDRRMFIACEWAYSQMAAGKSPHACELCHAEVTRKTFGGVILFGAVETMENALSDDNMLAAYVCNTCVTTHKGNWGARLTEIMANIFGSTATQVHVHPETGHA